MKLIVVVFFRMHEARAPQPALPENQTGALPLWTWFIANSRLGAGSDAAV